MILRDFLLRIGLDIDAASFAEGELAAEVIKGAFEKVVDVAKELVKGLAELVLETAESAHKVEELAQITGLSTEEIQDFSTAAEKSGSSTEAFAASIGFLSREMYKVKLGNKGATEQFEKLGIRVKDANGNLRDAGDVLLDLSDHFSSLPDGAEKTAQAMAVLGRGGAKLIPMLNKGRQGIADLAATSANFTEEQIEAGKDLTLGVMLLKGSWKQLLKEAVFPLLVPVSKLVKQAQAWVEANKVFLRQALTKVIKGIIVAVRILGSVLSGLVATLKFLADHWKLIAEIITALTIVVLGPHLEMIYATTLAYIDMGISALAAGAKAAAGWLLAVLPFALIAIGIAGVIIVLEDLYSYLTGGPSLIGDQLAAWKTFFSGLWNDDRFSAFRKWFEGLGQTWSLVTAAWSAGIALWRSEWKKLLDEIEKRLQPIIAASNWFARKVGMPVIEEAKRGSGASGGFAQPMVPPNFGGGRSGVGGAILDNANRARTQMAAQQLGAPQLEFNTNRKGGLEAFSPQFKATFHIAVQPGQSVEDAARAAQDQFDQWYSTKMEEAAASSGG